jgi:hypothetical protein
MPTAKVKRLPAGHGSLELASEAAPAVPARILDLLADLPRAPADPVSQPLRPQPAIVRGPADPLLHAAPAHLSPVPELS